ncbi:MAG: class I SAM-dependent methyltransferase [Polyangiaceae bacterium]|nr:class I SAM-dependent methyltransferase [Polyangiaceae bacterium]
MIANVCAQVFFNAIARRYDRDYALSGSVSRERIDMALAHIAGRHRVLVLGVGSGRELPRLLDAGHEAVGIDISAAMIALCNQRTRTIPILETDFWEPLPVGDRSFDAALALHGTLAHPPSRRAFTHFTRELGRVLRPRGVLVAEVPSSSALERIASLPTDASPPLPDGMRMEILSPTSYVHHDEVLGVSLDGVAYDAEGWRAIFSPTFDVVIEPLGEIEYMIVATNRL